MKRESDKGTVQGFVLERERKQLPSELLQEPGTVKRVSVIFL